MYDSRASDAQTLSCIFVRDSSLFVRLCDFQLIYDDAKFKQIYTEQAFQKYLRQRVGENIHISMFCPTGFFLNQIQIDQFGAKFFGKNTNI